MRTPPSLRPGRGVAPGLCLAALLASLVPSVAWAQPADKPADKPADPADAPKADEKQGGQASPPGQPTTPPSSDEKRPEGTRPVEGPAIKAHEPIDTIRYSDFMDTRITWTFGDDDILKATGERSPISPNPSVGDRRNYRLFFDNLNSRFAGRENLTHLVLYRKLPGFIPNLDTEAALVLRVDTGQLAARTNNVNSAFYDSGSYLRLFYKTGSYEVRGETRKTGFDLVFFPLDTDRFRLGYLYDISWGGTAQSINQSIFPRLAGQAPGAKFQYTGQGYYGFFGFKTAQITEVQQKVTGSQDIEFTRIQETNYGVLGGGGADLGEMVRIDAGAGYFQQGRFEQPGVQGKRVYTYGASGRLVLHDRMPVPSSVDFALYRNDPNAPMIIFRPEKYEAGVFAWALSFEGSHLRQNLRDFDRTGATKLQGASTGAVQATIKSGFLRVQATGIYRDLAFVLRSQPSFIPFESIPERAKTQPEIFFALAADYFLEKAHLTPGVGFGLQMPSTFGSSQTDLFGTEIGRVAVVRSQGDVAPLPDGKKRVPIINSRFSLRWDLSQMMAAILWVQYVRDNNATRIEQGEDGTSYLRTFVAPDFFGFGTALQARFLRPASQGAPGGAPVLTALGLGLALGYLGSIPAAGPLAMLIAASALSGQRRRTWLLAAGGASAEALYAFAAASGLGWVLGAHPSIGRWLRVSGAALVVALGLVMALAPSRPERDEQGWGQASALGTGFLLVALNPAFLATWLGFCALLGAHPSLAQAATPAGAPALAAGAFVGIVGWFLTLAALVARHRERLERFRQRLGRALGWLLVALGLLGLVRALLGA